MLEQCLKPNPNERPASAVEVYLRLQELGKASGILLLPPGAMEKLMAARDKSDTDPTVTYIAPAAKWRQWLGVGVAAAAVAGAAVWWFFLRG
jgi:hypothetical protein